MVCCQYPLFERCAIPSPFMGEGEDEGVTYLPGLELSFNFNNTPNVLRQL
jgi:hypothetical protein